MEYSKIRKMDVSNGPGVRVSIFMQGCPFHCEGCFNPETHPFTGGTPFTQETIEQVISLGSKSYIVGLSILGGEPLHPKNIEGTTDLARQWHAVYPDKPIWIWTGNTYETLKCPEVFSYIEVLVDGQFVLAQRDPRLRFAGSTNQRVIDMQKTLKKGEIVLWKEK